MVRSADDDDDDDDDDKVKTSDDTTTMSRKSGATSSKRRVECSVQPCWDLVLKQEGKRRARKKERTRTKRCVQTDDGRKGRRTPRVLTNRVTAITIANSNCH